MSAPIPIYTRGFNVWQRFTCYCWDEQHQSIYHSIPANTHCLYYTFKICHCENMIAMVHEFHNCHSFHEKVATIIIYTLFIGIDTPKGAYETLITVKYGYWSGFKPTTFRVQRSNPNHYTMLLPLIVRACEVFQFHSQLSQIFSAQLRQL